MPLTSSIRSAGAKPIRSLERQLARLIERGRGGARLGLERMEEALALLDDPQAGLRCVHIAGTNGKGSTAAMVEAIARRAGLKTGLYTSPHLCRFNERIQIDGGPIDDDAFAAALARALHRELPPLSLFETMTVAAFVAFAQSKVDLVVLEVGMGGRLDATNVLTSPLATAITSIGLDHARFLGTDLGSIAKEKAAIARPGAPLVVGPLAAPATLATLEVAERVGAAPIVWLDPPSEVPGETVRTQEFEDKLVLRFDDKLSLNLRPSLPGGHQRFNAAVAASVAWQLRATFPSIERHIERGIAETRWPGRLERLSWSGVEILLDCAHNLEGIATLRDYLNGVEPARTILIFGAIDEKPHGPMLDAIAPLATRRHYCRPIDPTAGRRAVEPALLATTWPGSTHERAEQALSAAAAQAATGELIVVTGSIFLVGAVRAAILGLERHAPMPL